MNTIEIQRKVEQLLDKVLTNPRDSEEIRYLQEKLNISREQVVAAWVYWDFAIRTYSNDAYDSAALRLVMHLHNRLPGSWHEKRQWVISKYLRDIAPQSICEIGFGVPQNFVKEFLGRKDIRIFLGEFEETSLSFARTLLPYWDPHWENKISLEIFDMNKDALPSGYQAIVFQDSIEHADSPTETLQRYVEAADLGAYFLFSLPIEIENPIPEHHICWKSEQDILTWLKSAGLNPIAHEAILMDHEKDLFALSLHPEFREVAILAQKCSGKGGGIND